MIRQSRVLHMSLPSLASATSSRLDGGLKHIQQCRVSQDHLTKLADGDEHEIMRNKIRYCVHKDELVLGIGNAWSAQDIKFQNQAYPRVLSSLGKLGDVGANQELREGAKMIKWMYHNVTSLEDRQKYLEMFRDGDPTKSPANTYLGVPREESYFKLEESKDRYRFLRDIDNVYDFVVMGYANTQGWGHAHHGDTMTSVHIGGLRTVMNGDFEVYTGDIIQWYWPFELNCFKKNGTRKPVHVANVDPGSLLSSDTAKLTQDAVVRKSFYSREAGTLANAVKTVALIKPYRPDYVQPRPMDWVRCFAQALSSGRPREPIDIRICRQAL